MTYEQNRPPEYSSTTHYPATRIQQHYPLSGNSPALPVDAAGLVTPPRRKLLIGEEKLIL